MAETPAKRYGTVPNAEQREMSGLAFVEGLVDGSLPLNTIAKTLDYDVTEASVGRVVVTAAPTGDHLNPQGSVHGGFSATLLDACMGLAVATTLEQGLGSTTLEFKISFMRPVLPDNGVITAVDTVLRSGRRAGYAEGKITDAAGKLLAHATTSCLIFERPN